MAGETVHRGGCTTKELSFWAIGLLTLAYSAFEIGVALWANSLTLLSDGFHNLSDVVSLGIAYWASKATRRGLSDDMTFGWARTEILGALINGTFLLSLCLYIGLEAIPEILEPSGDDDGWWMVGVGAAGVFVNTMGTVVFAITGQAHGHSHSHGHGHGHGHGGEDDHGHAHGSDEKSKLLGDHGHAHGGDDHGHAHGGGDHGHAHGGGDDHGHAHGGNDHGHGHGQKKKMCNFDMNTYAVFIHYLGDMVSSIFVVIAGVVLLIAGDNEWADYIDPIASWIIIILILVTTLPMVRRCGMIMLQSTPAHIDVAAIKKKIKQMNGVINVHDFHIWQLTDGMVICSLHVGVEESADHHFSDMAAKIKSVLHYYGIHSSAIQPEYLALFNSEVMNGEVCAQNCVEECEEDWCCKKDAESKPATEYSVDNVSYQNFQPFHEEA